MGLTFAIWGPFRQQSAARQLQMAVGGADDGVGSPHLRMARRGRRKPQHESPLEAAAYDRLGMPLT